MMTTVLHDFNFSAYDQFLAEIEGQPVEWAPGRSLEVHPQYDARMFALAKEFEGSDYFDKNFKRTLMQKQHEEITEDDVDEIARTSEDFFDVRAITSVVIFNERRMDGMWASMTEKGILRRLLQRLQSLTPEGFPNF